MDHLPTLKIGIETLEKESSSFMEFTKNQINVTGSLNMDGHGIYFGIPDNG
jgi:hypothetical protein